MAVAVIAVIGFIIYTRFKNAKAKASNSFKAHHVTSAGWEFAYSPGMRALLAHLRSPHITEFLRKTQTMKMLGFEVKKYRVSSVGGMDS